MSDDVYQRLVERLYAMPPMDRARGAPMKLTWAEFEWVWFNSGKDGHGGEFNTRAPTMADVAGSRVLGCPIVIVDEYGLHETLDLPSDKLELHGGPRDGAVINRPQGGATIVIPELFGGRTVAHAAEHPMDDMRIYTHAYSARTGNYIGGRMPNDDTRIVGRFTWFGPRFERLLAWWERKRKR